ncbi:MAG: hypothetical protein ACYS0G_06575 [Planctomycetota bacterium]
MNDSPAAAPVRSTGLRLSLPSVLAYCLPVVLVGLLSAIYAIAPEFYLDKILHVTYRETQVVEVVTFAAAFCGGLLLIWSAWRLWRLGKRAGGRGEWGGAVLIGMIAVASLFFAGEEISWGQSYLGWTTPETYSRYSHETNLHNTEIPVQSLGGVFVVTMFFALPLAWWLPARRWLPASWAPAIAEGPVVFSMAVAFVWKEFKHVYRLLVPDARDVTFYQEFVEQINEQKEMLVAVTLLMYGLYRVGKTGRGAEEGIEGLRD